MKHRPLGEFPPPKAFIGIAIVVVLIILGIMFIIK
jgi:hypothetical protein